LKDENFKGVIKMRFSDSTPWWREENHAPKDAPNIIFIVLDDTGYSQLGCYGSLIPTPNIDAIAQDGLRYTDFNTCALCSPSRASLLTGYDNHTVGMGFLAEIDMGFPSLAGTVGDQYGFLSEVLKDNGYSTYCVGKWHLCRDEEVSGAGPFDHWPLGRGFERYYGFLRGDTNQFYPELVQDNSIVDPPSLPEDGYHLSSDLVDKAIRFIATGKSVRPEKPFFCYLAFGATHSPYHAPQEYIDRFKGCFDEGYEVYREKVFRRQQEMGLLPEGAELTEINEFTCPWDSLDDWHKKVFVRYMEAFAGLLYYTDEQIGRLTDYLKKIGEYDNTMIVLLSDNGASAEGGVNGCMSEFYHFSTRQQPPFPTQEEYERIGTAESFTVYPTGWAWAGDTPLKLYKHWVHNGGVKVPCIISYPSHIQEKGAYRRQFHHITDIFPTVLDVCGIDMPEKIHGYVQEPRPGISMRYSFDAAADAPSMRHIQFFENEGNRALWKDGWKAVANHVVSPDFDEDQWELYNTAQDFCENHDLADQYPEKLQELKDLWLQEAEKVGAFPMIESHLRTINNFDIGKQRQPRPSKPVTHYSYLPEMDINAPVPMLCDKSFEITADVDYKAGDEGVLFSSGFNIGGYVLFIQDGKLRFHYNFQAIRYFDVESSIPLPEGRHLFGFAFRFEEKGRGYGVMTVDHETVRNEEEFTDTGFLLRICVCVRRYAGSPVYAGHKGTRDYCKYKGIFDRADIRISHPETEADQYEKLRYAWKKE